jgi:hypothetical protein
VTRRGISEQIYQCFPGGVATWREGNPVETNSAVPLGVNEVKKNLVARRGISEQIDQCFPGGVSTMEGRVAIRSPHTYST